MSGDLLRLHLGCGEVYLPGYVNIDLPRGEHSVQVDTRPDLTADLTTLDYPPESIAEIRLHHVFEHFTRPVALALLVRWYDWLADGATLTIETPDFRRMLRAFRRLGAPEEQSVALRHIFGSHEASWAIHCDGWYRERYERTLPRLGYAELEFRESQWHGTFNITVVAGKRAPFVPRTARLDAAAALLRESLVDGSESEERMLATWLDELRGYAR